MTDVRTQAELDAAIARGDSRIVIRSERGVWLRVADSRNSSVVARENSSVVAWGNSSVEARGNSSVEARGNSSVEAWENSSVEAWENSSVVARGNSSVEAWGNSSVEAWENSSVVAWAASCVRVKGGKKITASSSVAVHLFNSSVKVEGGVVIDVSKSLTDPAEWCDHHGVTVSKSGVATLYKAVDDAWTTPRGTDYRPGRKPTAPDWTDDHDCGGGLHFSPTPAMARDYHREATRFVEVGVRVADLRPIEGGTPKCKAPRVVRACVEVDINGKRVTA